MSVLYIITVFAGCTLPFLAENSRKDKIISGIFMLGDLILIAVMVYSDIAYMRYLGKPENVFVAGCLFILSITAKKIKELTNPTKNNEKVPKTHHQRSLDQNNKAAS